MAQKPVHELRLGRVKATIWANQIQTDTGPATRHNVRLTRLYKEDNAWKETNSFGRDELPLIAKVADRAHSWIYEHGSKAEFDETGAVVS